VLNRYALTLQVSLAARLLPSLEKRKLTPALVVNAEHENAWGRDYLNSIVSIAH
jgi:hypothetical protein